MQQVPEVMALGTCWWSDHHPENGVHPNQVARVTSELSTVVTATTTPRWVRNHDEGAGGLDSRVPGDILFSSLIFNADLDTRPVFRQEERGAFSLSRTILNTSGTTFPGVLSETGEILHLGRDRYSGPRCGVGASSQGRFSSGIRRCLHPLSCANDEWPFRGNAKFS